MIRGNSSNFGRWQTLRCVAIEVRILCSQYMRRTQTTTAAAADQLHIKQVRQKEPCSSQLTEVPLVRRFCSLCAAIYLDYNAYCVGALYCIGLCAGAPEFRL